MQIVIRIPELWKCTTQQEQEGNELLAICIQLQSRGILYN